MQRTRFVAGNRQIYSWILIGIMQSAANCGEPDSYALFSDVFYVNKWLTKAMSPGKRKNKQKSK